MKNFMEILQACPLFEGVAPQELLGLLGIFFSLKESGEPKLQSSESGLLKGEVLLSLKDIIPVVLPVSL